jgi:hypothetical protein
MIVKSLDQAEDEDVNAADRLYEQGKLRLAKRERISLAKQVRYYYTV